MPVILSFPTKLHEVTLVFITETGMRNVKKRSQLNHSTWYLTKQHLKVAVSLFAAV